MTILAKEIHAAVLAGGQGHRMDGADKGLVPFRGQALALRCALRIAAQVHSVSISANRNVEQYQALALDVFIDNQIDYQGPLAGVLAALKYCKQSCTAAYLMVLPCDVPFFPHDLVAKMSFALASHPSAMVAMVRARQMDGSMFVNPVFMLIKLSALEHLESFFLAGGRKITRWAGLAGMVVVDFDNAEHALSFTDADSKEQLLALEQCALL